MPQARKQHASSDEQKKKNSSKHASSNEEETQHASSDEEENNTPQANTPQANTPQAHTPQAHTPKSMKKKNTTRHKANTPQAIEKKNNTRRTCKRLAQLVLALRLFGFCVRLEKRDKLVKADGAAGVLVSASKHLAHPLVLRHWVLLCEQRNCLRRNRSHQSLHHRCLLRHNMLHLVLHVFFRSQTNVLPQSLEGGI